HRPRAVPPPGRRRCAPAPQRLDERGAAGTLGLGARPARRLREDLQRGAGADRGRELRLQHPPYAAPGPRGGAVRPQGGDRRSQPAAELQDRAQRDALRVTLEAVRPKFFIPVHGEYRQLLLHSELAAETGIDATRIAVVEDGETVELDGTKMKRGEKVGTGLVYVDGLGVGDGEQVVLRDRRHLAEDGILVVTLTLDSDTGTSPAGPDLISRGVIEPELSTRLMASARRAAMA